MKILSLRKTGGILAVLAAFQMTPCTVSAASPSITPGEVATVTDNVFVIDNPDFIKSPYSGMTRRHWLDAGKYILNGAFGYIHSLDDPMYFPKQLDKTYPANEKSAKVAKLEGLARTLFVAAPLLKENPDLELNGIKVGDYYRHQLVSLSNPESKNYIPHRTGGPSQTLLELGSLAISMKAAPEVLWEPLSKKEKDDLAALMLSYGNGPSIGSNWMFFNVFIMSFLKDEGYEVNEPQLKEFLEKLADRYRGEGWYNDAPAYDYYSMWAYQTYGPIWASMFGHQYPEIAATLIKNQGDMIDNYPYMFSKDGKMNMWGRSICYRFACVSLSRCLSLENMKVSTTDGSAEYHQPHFCNFLRILNFWKTECRQWDFTDLLPPQCKSTHVAEVRSGVARRSWGFSFLRNQLIGVLLRTMVHGMGS